MERSRRNLVERVGVSILNIPIWLQLLTVLAAAGAIVVCVVTYPKASHDFPLFALLVSVAVFIIVPGLAGMGSSRSGRSGVNTQARKLVLADLSKVIVYLAVEAAVLIKANYTIVGPEVEHSYRLHFAAIVWTWAAMAVLLGLISFFWLAADVSVRSRVRALGCSAFFAIASIAIQSLALFVFAQLAIGLGGVVAFATTRL